MIGLVILAGFSLVQFRDLNHINSEYGKLVADFDQLYEDYERQASWGGPTDEVVSFLEDVVQLNVTKYFATLVSNTIEHRSDLGGITEEILKYTLTSDDSEINVDFRFRNQTLSRCRLDVLEFAPHYTQPQPNNVLDLATAFLQRYQDYSGATYLTEMSEMLKTVTEIEDMEKTQGNIKLAIITAGNDVEIQWIYTTNNIAYQSKGVILSFDNGVLEELADGWSLYHVGSTVVNISEDEAINIAKDYAKDYSWTVGGVKVTDFTIQEEPVSVTLLPHIRDEPSALIPYWYVTLHLDKVYPGDVNRIAVGLWADTGEVVHCKELSK
jgi:hypothetical protein